jgi:hypothetical protein
MRVASGPLHDGIDRDAVDRSTSMRPRSDTIVQ